MAIFWHLKQRGETDFLFQSDLFLALQKITEFHQKIGGCPTSREEGIFEHFYAEDPVKKIEAWVMFAKTSSYSQKVILQWLNAAIEPYHIYQIWKKNQKCIPPNLNKKDFDYRKYYSEKPSRSSLITNLR